MNNKKLIKKNKRYLAILSIFSILLFLFLQLSVFTNFNNLFIDPLLGDIAARKEVVVVGIDDKSLQSVGAWPWTRDIFANAFDNISAQKPVAVGIDVLFLEPREGDAAFANSIRNNGIPVILGSKISDGELLTSVFSSTKNAYSGFVNLAQDLDGKIRNTQVFQKTSTSCEVSFGLALAAKYFAENPTTLCDPNLSLRNNSYDLNTGNTLQFSYTRQSFTQISFSDVIAKNYDPGFFEDKIVLIGSTALDVRSELNDNFTDIFGDTIPGVAIHANIINSFLQNSFFNDPSPFLIITIYLLLTLIFAYLFLKVKKAIYDLLLMFIFQGVNFALTLILINFGIILPFIQIAIFILAVFIFSLGYRYLTKSRESQYVKTIFSRYLNKDLLNILLQNSDKLQLGGETKNMTVMFSDIRSFTTISEGLTSQQLIEMLNNYLSYMTDIILSNRGTVDKYIGDAIMAIWNAPLDDAQHAENAIQAALNMKVQLLKFGEMYPQYPEIKIGVGLNTGDMTVGNVGGKDRFDYTVLGDNVNLGSRLEGLTKKYGVVVIVSESTKKSYEDAKTEGSKEFKFRLLDDMKVKGKNDSVKIYEPFTSEDFVAAQTQLETYAEGFTFYQDGDFKKAKEVLEKNNKDKASTLLLERVEELLKNPPKDWHGIWKWEEK